MNCQQIRDIWDDYRDGQLTDSPRYSFEHHLHGCPHCAELWAFETQWLEKIGCDEQDLDAPQRATPGPHFALAVAKQWEKESRWRFRLPHPRRFALAASVAMVLSAGVILMIPRTAGSPHDPLAVGAAPRAVAPSPQIAAAPASPQDPVGELVLELSDGINRRPAEIRDAFGDAASMLTIDRLVDVLERTEPPQTKDE